MNLGLAGSLGTDGDVNTRTRMVSPDQDDSSTVCPSDHDMSLIDLEEELDEVLEEQCVALEVPLPEIIAKAGPAKKKDGYKTRNQAERQAGSSKKEPLTITVVLSQHSDQKHWLLLYCIRKSSYQFICCIAACC